MKCRKKLFAAFAVAAAVLLIVGACMLTKAAQKAERERYDYITSHYSLPPMLMVDDELFFYTGRNFEALPLRSTEIGELETAVKTLTRVYDNFQTNLPYLVGCKLYTSEEEVLVLYDGVYMRFERR